MSNILHPLIWKDDKFEAYLEKTEDNRLFVHMYVHDWAASTYKHIFNLWVELIEELNGKGYSEVYAASKDEKLCRFASMFGFNKTEEKVQDSAGEIREILKCSISMKDI